MTVSELEYSGYNEAAQYVSAGDQQAAAVAVLSHPGRYDDAENTRVRRKAAAVLGA